MILSLIVSLLELIDRSMITSRSMFSSLWVSRTGSASDFCALQEALCKCIDTIQYDTIQYNTIRYNTIQYNTIQYNTIQYNTIQYNTIQYNTIQYNTIQLHVLHCIPLNCITFIGRYNSAVPNLFGLADHFVNVFRLSDPPLTFLGKICKPSPQNFG